MKTINLVLTYIITLVCVCSCNYYIDNDGNNYGRGININGVTWAPVNCGYHPKDFPYGKMYQWGRKYGQAYISSENDDTYDDHPIVRTIFSNTYVSVENGNAYQNAHIFYTPKNFPKVWTKSQDLTLWNSGTEEQPIKTENDPCPNGWRVPTSKELKSLADSGGEWGNYKNMQGMWFYGVTSRVFFPASGAIYDNGFCSMRESSGWYWSSTPCEIHPYMIFADDGSSWSDFFSWPVYGYSVRCVKE